mgnify:CR=1 FL=1
MTSKVSVDLIDTVTPMVETRVREAARRLPHLRYADIRLEVTEAKGAGSENGTPKFSGDDYGFALGARVLAGDRMIAPGYVGQTLGTADLADLDRIVREALERAYRRAMVNGEMKADARRSSGPLGESLADTRLHPVEVRQDTVAAVYRVDPRTMALTEMVRYATDVSRQVARRRHGRQVQLRRDGDRALARALRVERGRADRSVVRADPWAPARSSPSTAR